MAISHVIVVTYLYPSAEEESIPLRHLAIQLCHPQAVVVSALIVSAQLASFGSSSIDSSIGVVI